MKKIVCLLIFLSFIISSSAQEEKDRYAKTNTIWFAESSLGLGSIYNGENSAAAFNFNFTANYQHKKSLYTLRYNYVADISVTFIFFFPVPTESQSINELGLLYGRRWLFEGGSLSVSGGASLNNYKSNIIGGEVFENSNHIGFPFEINARLFKKKKGVYRAFYGLIPVGKPTAFGRGVGLKLSGNIANRGFISFGITFSLGAHKYY